MSKLILTFQKSGFIVSIWASFLPLLLLSLKFLVGQDSYFTLLILPLNSFYLLSFKISFYFTMTN